MAEKIESSKGHLLGRARYRTRRAATASSSRQHIVEQAVPQRHETPFEIDDDADLEGDRDTCQQVNPEVDSTVEFRIKIVPFETWMNKDGLTDLRAPAYRNMLMRRVRQAGMRYIKVPEWIPTIIADYNDKLIHAHVSRNLHIFEVLDNLSITNKRQFRESVESLFDRSSGLADSYKAKAPTNPFERYPPGSLTGRVVAKLIDFQRTPDIHHRFFFPPDQIPHFQPVNHPSNKNLLDWREHLPSHYSLPYFEGTSFQDAPFEHWKHDRNDGDWYHVGAIPYRDLLHRAQIRTKGQNLAVNARREEYKGRLKTAMAAPGVPIEKALQALDDYDLRSLQRHVCKGYDRIYSDANHRRYLQSKKQAMVLDDGKLVVEAAPKRKSNRRYKQSSMGPEAGGVDVRPSGSRIALSEAEEIARPEIDLNMEYEPANGSP